MTEGRQSDAPRVPVICVAAGKGGVGKSTVAAALAKALTAAGTPATVLDCDIQGPSLPALLDLPPAQAVDGRIIPTVLADGTRAFSLGQVFPTSQHLSLAEAGIEALVRFMAGGIELADTQVLIVDLPPGTAHVQHLINTMWNPRTLLVTTGAKVAHADARRSAQIAQRPLGIVENLTRATAHVEGRPVEVRLYDGAQTSELAAELQLPYLGSLPHQADLDALAASPEMTAVAQAAIAAINETVEA